MVIKENCFQFDDKEDAIFNSMNREQKKLLMDSCRTCLGKSNEPYYFSIDRIKISGPATIVFWGDGEKTVVKCMEGDTFNYEMGIAMCVLKKLLVEDSYRALKKRMKDLIEREASKIS